MKLVLIIDGPSVDELFAVGPKDLTIHFLPKWGINPDDIVCCYFEEKKDGKTFVHKDNIYKK